MSLRCSPATVSPHCLTPTASAVMAIGIRRSVDASGGIGNEAEGAIGFEAEADTAQFWRGRAMGAAAWLVPAPCDYRHQDGHSHPWARDDAVRPDFARL